jgi:hypothetical protein
MRRITLPFEAGQFDVSSWWRKNTKWGVLWLAINATLAVYAQADGQTQPNPAIHSHDRSDNTFQASPVLPDNLRRVVVLPLAWEGTSTDLSQGCEVLGPIILTELINTKRFEAVAVSPENLQHQTGRQSWTGAEILPADFLDSLKRVYGCDAVLFCQLTAFRPYAPLAVGWRMKLVEVRTGRILWAVDKVFDAKSAPAHNKASLSSIVEQWFSTESSNKYWRIENSPRQFCRYTLVQIFSNLPNPKETTKVSSMTTDMPSRR